MNRVLAAGLVLGVVGVAGYVVGVLRAYPGRSFAVTSVMVGVTAIAIGFAREGEAT